MIAGLFVVYGKEYVKLCKRIGKDKEADEAERHVANMIEAVKAHGWDGDWYLRAYDFLATKLARTKMRKARFLLNPKDGVLWPKSGWKRVWSRNH